MSNDKTYDRHVNIWINGKEVKNDISSIKKEMFNLTNELGRTTRGTKEYNEKAAELKKVKGILKEHQEAITASKGAWDNLKGSFGAVMGVIGAGYGIIQSFKGIIESTDESSDKFARTMGGVKSAIGEVSRAMADGNFKDFFKNIKSAVEEGRRYVDTQDAIGDSARALSLEEEKVADEILALKIIQADATKSRDEQMKAGEEIERKQSELADKRAVQAQKTLDNEMESARFKSKLDDETIRSFLRQDEAMVKNMEVGKQYYDLVQQYNALTTTQLIFQGGKIKDQMEALGADAPKFAAIYAGMSKVTEDHRDRIVTAEKEVAEAKRSATEDILRQINKLNSARAAEADEAAKNAEKITKAEQDRQDARREQEIIASIENQKFIDDEIKRMEDEAEKKKEAQEKADEALLQAKADFATSIIGLGKTLFDRQLSMLDAQYKKDIEAAGDNAEQKEKIEREYNAKKIKIQRKAAIAEKASALFNIAIDTAKGVANAASKVLTIPMIPWIIANGIIQAAIIAAKPIPQFWKGGFSKHGGYTPAGGKYQPVGIVHAGEWIANQDMVASPVTGPIIEALEYHRQNSFPGYANGGRAGSSSSGYEVAGSSPIFTGINPKFEKAIDLMIGLLADLKRDGVTTRFDYLSVKNIRRGMARLDEIDFDTTIL